MTWPGPTDPITDDLYFSRHDKTDPRLGEVVKPVSDLSKLNREDTVILGYPDDEGVKANGGRAGSALGPDSIRRVLYKMTPLHTLRLHDAGNLRIEGSLSEKHRRASEVASRILGTGARLVSLGGGHDYGFSDLYAFCERTLKAKHKPFVINFDAHLDARPGDSENSGTSFFRLLNEYGSKIDFFEVGIQDWCNAAQHLKWVIEKGGQVVTFSDLLSAREEFTEFMQKRVIKGLTARHRMALSIDIDCFEASTAPGASQVFPVGISSRCFLKFWTLLLKKHSPQFCGIYETNPTFDLDQRTSKWAAILLHRFLHS